MEEQQKSMGVLSCCRATRRNRGLGGKSGSGHVAVLRLRDAARLYGPDDFAQLEAMPTRVQSYQYLLGCLQMPAVSVLAALRARQEAMARHFSKVNYYTISSVSR